VPADELESEAAAEAAGLFTADEVRGELERLRADLDAASARPARVVAGQIGPCALPAGVPELGGGVRVSSEMRQLALALLPPTSGPTGGAGASCRVGFCGMGGIGKTTISTWLVRRDDVRQQFDAIAWLPLGQTPSVVKCQDLLHLQLTGSELAAELGPDERREKLRQAMLGVKLLLVLDGARLCTAPLEHAGS
jgi:hypothetical protein